MKHILYAIATFCFLIILTCHYTPLQHIEARGDAWHYREMALGHQVPQPFVDRIAIPVVVRFLNEHIDISGWTFGRVENVDAWYFVLTFICLWITAGLVRLTLLRLNRSDESAALAGFLYLSTFWLSGFQLSDFWLQDPVINLCIWTGCYLWTFRWWYGILGILLAMVIKGGTLGYNWAVISMACSFVPDIPSLIYAFGFLWLAILYADRRLLVILALLFICGRIVTADVARACVAVFSFPIMLGVATMVDRHRLGQVGVALIFMAHLYQQSTWLFAPH